jgi:Secretion system C-terminal sorting domain/FG-GAP-like repeat
MNIIQQHKRNLAHLRHRIKTLCSAAILAGSLLLATQTQAQTTFGAAQTNPFSLTRLPVGDDLSAATLADMDNDGDLDMLSGSFNYSSYVGSFYYYENTGTTTAPVFVAPIANPFGLSSQIIIASPRLVDMDNDGDFDIMSGDASGAFNYYENTGTAAVPSFSAVQSNPFSLTNAGGVNIFDFADLDGDGDMDMMIGDINGTWNYAENTGTVSAPVFASFQTTPFGLTNITTGTSYDIRPTFFDADADGDFDLLVGGYNNDFHYYQNTGTTTAPIFAADMLNPFGLSALPSMLICPAFGDMDNDGDLDLLTGSLDGNFYYSENTTCLAGLSAFSQTSDTLRATSTAVGLTYQWLNCTTNMLVAGQTASTFVPNLSGQFALIATQGACVDTSTCFNFTYSAVEQTAENQLLVFPNPVTDILNINSSELQNATIRIINANGQVVLQQQNCNGSRFTLDIQQLPASIYVVEIESAKNIVRQKITKK